MKNIFIICLIILALSAEIIPQQKPVIWEGKLRVNTMDLRLVFRLFMEDENIKGFMDSPDQGAKDIPVTKISQTDSSIRFDVASINGYFEGKPSGDSITGSWHQGPANLPLVLRKVEKTEEVKRPQTPQPPYPYNEEEVTFKNEKAGITLAGTFTCPKGDGKFPAVILVTGSGKQDRDESLFDHKPFLVIADYLTRKGIAVLRYDDRGAGKSGGDFSKATTLDFTDDAISAVNYLITRKEVDVKKIGIAGHSEGGLIAPIAANKSKNVAFIIMMAGPGLKGEDILLLQSELLGRAEGMSEEDIKNNMEASKEIYALLHPGIDSTEFRNKVSEIIKKQYDKIPEKDKSNAPPLETIIESTVKQYGSPWFRFFLNYDPKAELEKVKVPVLAINGEKDLQVPPKQNLAAIEKALKKAGNKNFKTVEMKGLNHLFQECKTGSVSEYGKIEQTFSPQALDLMADWILKTVK